VPEGYEIGVAMNAAEKMCWMIDSGATSTHHITPHKSNFKDYTPCQGSICLGDKSTISQVGIGSVIFNMSLGIPITLNNVLHIPGVSIHFLSTHVLAQKGAEISFAKDSFKVTVNQCCFAKGYLEDNLYWLDISSIGTLASIKHTAISLDIWHQHMGHISYAALKSHSPSALTGMVIDSSTSAPSVCRGCAVAKSTHQPFSLSKTKWTMEILQVVHSDLVGPLQTH
jgi:hypothetical protein